jgi:hypothetical protein
VTTDKEGKSKQPAEMNIFRMRKKGREDTLK